MEVNVREKSKKYEPRTSNFDHLREMEGPSHEGWVGSGVEDYYFQEVLG